MRFFTLLCTLLLCCAGAGAGATAAAKLPYSVTPYSVSLHDREMLTRVEQYLTGIHSISSEFLQTSPSGDITNGKFYLQRPGKLRMEYNPPTPVLMVTSGSDIVYYDKELDQISRISLDSTLVGFLARDDVKFDSSVTITKIENADKAIRISLIQTKKPKDGMLTLEFSDGPLLLRNMNVTDSSGQVTTVSLNNARFNMPLPSDLFVFHDPHLGGSYKKH
jgi:outer membrane lipoprotein-sorting protein